MAHTYLKNNFQQNFLPKPVDGNDMRPDSSNKPDANVPPKKKNKASALATFLNDDDDGSTEDDDDIDLPIANLVPGVEELDAYLVLPQAHHVTKSGEDFSILSWWKEHSHMFPNLSKMARQYLALPASSAGVERLFSAAGRMNSSFRKSTTEESLEVQLVVYQNT